MTLAALSIPPPQMSTSAGWHLVCSPLTAGFTEASLTACLGSMMRRRLTWFRFFTCLKAKLMPYLYKTAIAAATEGIPSMRSMVLRIYKGQDLSLSRQTVYARRQPARRAPIFNDESRAEYYLPQGIWTNFFTGREYRRRHMD